MIEVYNFLSLLNTVNDSKILLYTRNLQKTLCHRNAGSQFVTLVMVSRLVKYGLELAFA